MTNTIQPDEPLTETTHEEQVVTLEDHVETSETSIENGTGEAEKSEWQRKAEEYLDDLKRLQADFENYKKRVKNDEKELYGHLSAQIVTDLIPVLDNFHMATEHVPADAAESPWVTGITYIEKQFEDVLRNYGVEPLEVKPGDRFDPTQHEALDHKVTEDAPSEPHKIEKVVQKGYKIKDRIIRPAKVIVA